MGIECCDIFYDNPACTYYEGQTVNGRVEFTFNSTKKFRGIKIEFIGESNVFWEESHERKDRNGRNETYNEHYNAYEEYFKIKYYLYGSASNGEYELGPGKHAFPFTCALPPGLPSSFEGEYGYIRYTIKVTIDRPWKYDHEYKFAFTVVSVYDLNSNEKLRHEVNDVTSKTFCCCWCKSGPFNMTVNIPCTGFVPGQTIPINVDCDNASSTEIEYLVIELMKTIQYYADSPHRKTKTQELQVKNVATDGLAPGEQATFCEEIEVPPLPPSNLANCSLIDIDYKLRIKAKVGGCSSSPRTTIYIQIGTIPIHDKVNDLVPHDTISEPGSESGSEKASQPLQPQVPTPGGGIGWNNQQGYPPPNNGYQPILYPPPGGTPNPYQPTTYPSNETTPNPYPPAEGNPYPPAIQYPNNYPPTQNPQTPYPSNAPYPPQQVGQSNQNYSGDPSIQQPQTPYPSNAPYPPQQVGQPNQNYPGGPPPQQMNYGVPYPAMPPTQHAQPPYPVGPQPIVNLPSNIPPPTYSEGQFRATSIQSRTDSEHVNFGTQNFAPRYPVYNLPPSAPPAP